MNTINNEYPSVPFLRWTGSKRWFTRDYIKSFLPSSFNNYHEPFLGAGSVFFFMKEHNNSKIKYYLSDSNEELINCYLSIKENPDRIIHYLSLFKNTKEDYYHYREQNYRLCLVKAARFLYLNRTSFNGIYRVNSDGKYNVPYGNRPKVDIVTPELLKRTSDILKDVNLNCTHFENTIVNIQEGDLVFLDPPYTVAHENNGFIEYNQKLFSWEDQLLLKKYIIKIIEKQAYFILTNASHSSILDLYKDIGSITKLARASQVGGRNKTRGTYNELVICNTI